MSSYRPRSGVSNFDRRSANLPLMKMRLESEIVRKREAEVRRTETARSNDRYFQQWNVQTEKFDDWTSPRSAQLSSRQARQQLNDMEVEQRREQLKKLYYEDKIKQEQALQKLKEDDERRKWENMRDKVKNFRHSKSVALQEIVEKNEHELWKSKSDRFKAFESELKKQQQNEYWEKQLREKEEERMRMEEEKRREELEMKRLVEKEKQREQYEQVRDNERKLKCRNELEEQMRLLREKEDEANQKRLEQEKLLAESNALEEAREAMMRREQDAMKKKQTRDFLTKQHLAKLRQRSKEVAADLQAEADFAHKFIFSANRDPSEEKEKARQDMQRYLQLVEQHRKFEVDRQKQMEFLFQEEAKKMWEKREQDWENERLARKKLLEEVIAAQKIQIDHKLQVALKERDQLLKDREEILQTVESYQNKMKAKKDEEKEKQIQTKHVLLSQMDYKRQQEEEAARLEKEEIDRRQKAEQAFDEKHWSLAMDRMRLY